MTFDSMLIYILFIIVILLLCYVIIRLVQQQRQITLSLREASKKQELLLVEQSAKTEKNMQQDIFKIQTNTLQHIHNNFNKFSEIMDKRITYLQQQVDSRLDKNFEQTTRTFNNVIERLTKIDQAQKKIDDLSTNIVSLQDILHDKKSRGAFGELQLVNLLKSVFGVNNNIYQTQVTLSNRSIVDVMLYAPEPMGNVAIDSKFPLENYRRMIGTHNPQETAVYEKQFKNDVRKHINDIALKYIVPNETAEYAVLFLPAEAIFAYINAYCQDIVDYSYQKKVWITSPTTFMAILTTLQVVLQNIERDRYANVIKNELNLLSKEFARYQERWASLAKHIDQVSKDVREVNITTDKITSRFSKIEQVELTESIDDDLPPKTSIDYTKEGN